MSFSYHSLVEQKIKTAQAIAAGCCEGTYADGALILCSLISGMAAIAWPGKRTDKKRFVEIIIRFPPLGVDPKKISAPLLVQYGKDCNARLGISEKSFHVAEANDLSEEDVMKSCPGLGLLNIRKYSYAALLYDEIRNNYVHQCRRGEKTREGDSLRQIAHTEESSISYVNENRNGKEYRLIYFPIKWIARVAEGVARGLDIEVRQRGKMLFDDLCFELPAMWWLDGARLGPWSR